MGTKGAKLMDIVDFCAPPQGGNVTRQAFDAARGEGHFLDLLWGGFPGADAPSIGTEKTAYAR